MFIASWAYSLPLSIRSFRVSSPLRGAKRRPASIPIVKYLIAVRIPLSIAFLPVILFRKRAVDCGLQLLAARQRVLYLHAYLSEAGVCPLQEMLAIVFALVRGVHQGYACSDGCSRQCAEEHDAVTLLLSHYLH